MKHDDLILYVEDDPQSREVMQIILVELMGHTQVVMFEDSHNFLARVDALPKPPAVVLLDIHVAPHTGFEMLKMLRQHSTLATVTVVALTASVMNEEIHLLKTSGFDGAVAKPVNMDTFPSLLERILADEKIWHVTD